MRSYSAQENEFGYRSLLEVRRLLAMGKKLETIRKALNSKGIVITEGIPEQIESILSEQGYKIKKKKHNKPAE